MFIRCPAYLFLALVLGGMSIGMPPALAALATMPANECDVSESAPNSGCSLLSEIGSTGAVVVNDTTAPVLGARSVTATNAVTPIDAYGFCRYVNNASENSIFVPFRTTGEWQAFIKNHPQDVNLTDCSRGGLVTIPANFGSSLQTNQCSVATPTSQNYTAPYRTYPPGASITAPGVLFNCQSPTGTTFTETAVAQYTGLDSSSSEPGNAGVVGWTLSNVVYTYNGMCGSANGVATLATPSSGLCNVGVPSGVTLSNQAYGWTCSGGNGGGTAASCGAPLQVAQCGSAVVDINGNLTNGNFCAMGTASGVNTANASYTCTYGSGVTQTSASCQAIMPGQCGSDAGQTLASTPVNLCSASDTASPVTQTDTGWTWSCALAGESDTVACSATAVPPPPPTPSCSAYVWNTIGSAGQLSWSNVGMSGNGNRIVASAYTPHWVDSYTYNEYNYISSDGGNSWVQLSSVSATAMTHSSAALNSDGSHILIDQPSVVSSDAGNSWSSYVSGGASYQMASSADGNLMVEAPWYYDATYGSLPISRDGGLHWAHSGFPDWGFVSTGMSDDGQIIAAVGNNNYVFISTDGGQSAVKRQTAGTRMSSVAVSGDGSTIYATGGGAKIYGMSNQYIYKSLDHGQSWIALTSAGANGWNDIATNFDGTRIIVQYYNTSTTLSTVNTFISVDGGASWCPQIAAGQFAMSKDGKKVIAIPFIAWGNTGLLKMGVSP